MKDRDKNPWSEILSREIPEESLIACERAYERSSVRAIAALVPLRGGGIRITVCGRLVAFSVRRLRPAKEQALPFE